MIVNEALVKYLFNRHTIIKNLAALAIMLVLITVLLICIITALYSRIYMNYESILNTVYVPEYYEHENELLAKCKAVNCLEVISYEGGITSRYTIAKNNKTADKLDFIDNHDIPLSIISRYLSFRYNLIVYNQDEKYIIDNSEYIRTFLYMVLCIYAILIIFFLVIMFYNTRYNYKNAQYEKGSYKMYAESKIQGNITEMLHHEISAPISILKTSTSELFNMFSANIKKDNEEEAKQLRSGIEYSLDRLDAILSMLYQSRDIKKNEETTIFETITYIVTTVNRINIGKLSYIFEDNNSILDNIKVSKQLGNGNFMNILNVMLTNSIEAGGTNIIFKPNLISSKFLELYITDNGRGIRDKNNNIIKTDPTSVVTEYGYSSKDKKGNHIVRKSLLQKILSVFGLRIISTNTNRGIGLYMNKMLLMKVGGSINVVSTSQEGTTFKLKVPIEPYEFKY